MCVYFFYCDLQSKAKTMDSPNALDGFPYDSPGEDINPNLFPNPPHRCELIDTISNENVGDPRLQRPREAPRSMQHLNSTMNVQERSLVEVDLNGRQTARRTYALRARTMQTRNSLSVANTNMRLIIERRYSGQNPNYSIEPARPNNNGSTAHAMEPSAPRLLTRTQRKNRKRRLICKQLRAEKNKRINTNK